MLAMHSAELLSIAALYWYFALCIDIESSGSFCDRYELRFFDVRRAW
jgi:hypothetical protein